MKIAVIADIHCNYKVFKKAYEDALSRGVEMFFFLGDQITDGFEANEVLNLVKTSPGYALSGNREIDLIKHETEPNPLWKDHLQFKSMQYCYDSLTEENFEYIKTLPIYRIVEINNTKICMSHNTPYTERGYVGPNDFDLFDQLIEEFDCNIYLFGHQHIDFEVTYKSKLFINPNSVGLPSTSLPYRYGILTLDEGIHYESIGIEYDYQELEAHYHNSDYYKIVPQWCELMLMTMRDGINHAALFFEYVMKETQKNNIFLEYVIPNDIFESLFEEYSRNK